MKRTHRKNPMGTVGMDYSKKPAVIETPQPQPPISQMSQMSLMSQIPQSPHPASHSLQYSYPSYKKISKSKRFQKD
jgi:hypothetical protein